jgi:hypothetical protein
MANNHSFPLANPLANLPACHSRQPGHWGHLLGARQTPLPSTQQEFNVAWANHLLDGGQLRQEEEELSSDDEINIDPQLRTQGVPNTQALQLPLPTQAVPAPRQCYS